MCSHHPAIREGVGEIFRGEGGAELEEKDEKSSKKRERLEGGNEES
jgi:hypothetical protein